MEQIFLELAGFIEANQAWVFPVVALIAFGESLVLVGLVIPATAVMLLIGGLAGAGVVAPLPVLTGAVLGAILGDVVSYAIGRWLGPSVVYRPILRRYRPAVARTRLFFRRYGLAAVFIGRFLGPIRSTVPLVAGVMAMSQARFQLADVTSALLWAPLMLAPGFLGARSAGELTAEEALGVLALVLAATMLATLFIAPRVLRNRTAARPIGAIRNQPRRS